VSRGARPIQPPRRETGRGAERGFSFVELTIVLLVIGLMLGATAIGGDLARTASYNVFFSRFVVAWSEAYKSYKTATGGVPGHTAPGQIVNGNSGGTTARCTSDLRADMVGAAIALPPGRGLDKETLALFQGPDGRQHQADICFLHVTDWTANPGGAVLAVNVMRISGLSADLAARLDVAIDTYADAANGDFRRGDTTAYKAASATAWPQAFSDEELQTINTVTAFYRMP